MSMKKYGGTIVTGEDRRTLRNSLPVPVHSAGNGTVYHNGTSYVPKFHTGTYQYVLYTFNFFSVFWRYILVSL